jgi:HK97 family phage major capsid protein
VNANCAIALYAALPNVYRKNAVMIMSDSVRSQITTSFEAATHTLGGGVEEVLRKRIVVSPNMPAFAAGQVGIVFADKRFLIQRRVKGDAGNFVRRYNEAIGAIEQGLTCVEGFMRADYQPLNTADAHFPPCSVLNVHA